MAEKKPDLVVEKADDLNKNPDPITGEHGSHPVGTGIGAATAGTVGAVVGGVLGGPVGGVVGAAIGGVVGTAIGGVAGGLVGKEVAEQINPTVEDVYWRDNFTHSSYIPPGSNYELYQPAYQYGWESRGRYTEDYKFDDVEADLSKDWESLPANSTLGWDRARPAVRDAWNRIDNNRTKNLIQPE